MSAARYVTESWAEAVERVPELAPLSGQKSTPEMLARLYELVDTRPGLYLLQMAMNPYAPTVFVFRRIDPVICLAEDIAPGDKEALLHALKNAPAMPIVPMPAPGSSQAIAEAVSADRVQLLSKLTNRAVAGALLLSDVRHVLLEPSAALPNPPANAIREAQERMRERCAQAVEAPWVDGKPIPSNHELARLIRSLDLP